MGHVGFCLEDESGDDGQRKPSECRTAKCPQGCVWSSMEGGKARRKNVLANNGRMSSGSSSIATRVQKEEAIALEVFESNLLTMKVTRFEGFIPRHGSSARIRPCARPMDIFVDRCATPRTPSGHDAIYNER